MSGVAQSFFISLCPRPPSCEWRPNGVSIPAMSTLAEIEVAVKSLPRNEREELALKLIADLRAEGGFLTQPRDFSAEEMQAWFDEDEREGRAIREMLGTKSA